MMLRCAYCWQDIPSHTTLAEFRAHLEQHGVKIESNRQAQRLIDKWWGWQVQLSSPR